MTKKGEKLSPETRAKISAAKKGGKLSDEHVAKLKASMTPERRAKISAALKGRKLSDETRAKMKGRKLTDEHRAKMSSALAGRELTPQHRARISASKKGQKHTGATRAKLSVAQKGRPPWNKGLLLGPLSDETKAKISAGMKGNENSKDRSIETRAKIAAANRGKKHTVETRAKLVAAQHRRYGTLEEQLLRQVRKTRGCWLWEGSNKVGRPNSRLRYGVLAGRKAHRVSYELFVGPIEPGNHIHHICGNSLCVRPSHLEQVSGKDHRFIHSFPDGWERYLYKRNLVGVGKTTAQRTSARKR